MDKGLNATLSGLLVAKELRIVKASERIPFIPLIIQETRGSLTETCRGFKEDAVTLHFCFWPETRARRIRCRPNYTVIF